MGFFSIKRPKSATNRDRKYKSQEPHEQAYVRKSRPKNPHYMADGGGVGKFKVGDKVRIAYINDNNEHNGEIGTITYLNEYNYYPKGDMSVVGRKTQGEITYHNGDVEEVSDFYREGSGLVSPIEKVKLRKAKEYVNTQALEKLKKEWNEKNNFADGGGVEEYKPFRVSVLDENGREQYEYFDDEIKAYERFIEYKADFNDTALEKLVEGNEYETIQSYDPDNDNDDNYEYGGDLTDENMVVTNLINGEISVDVLTEIIGCEPAYPNQYVGMIKLQKCFLRPYYRIIR